MIWDKHTIENIAGRILISSLCGLLLLSVFLPRILGFAPGIMGISGAVLFYSLGKQISLKSLWPLSGWIALIGGYAALSILWAVAPDVSTTRILKVFPLLLGGMLCLCIPQMLQKSDICFFERIFPPVLLAANLLCIFELYSGAPVYKLLHSTENGFNLSALNRSIIFITLSFFPALTSVHRGNGTPGYKKFMILALIITLGLVFLKTHSQSAHFAFVIGVAFYFLFPSRFRFLWIALCLLFAAGCLAAPWIAQTMFHNFSQVTDQYVWLKQSYASTRMEIWDFIARKILEKPLYGYGIEATRSIRDFETQRIYHPDSHVLHPHNFILQIWIEFGLLGIAVACSFFSYLVFRIKDLNPFLVRTALATLMATLSVATTAYGLWQGWWLGTFFLLTTFLLLLNHQDESEK